MFVVFCVEGRTTAVTAFVSYQRIAKWLFIECAHLSIKWSFEWGKPRRELVSTALNELRNLGKQFFVLALCTLGPAFTSVFEIMFIGENEILSINFNRNGYFFISYLYAPCSLVIMVFYLKFINITYSTFLEEFQSISAITSNTDIFLGFRRKVVDKKQSRCI